MEYLFRKDKTVILSKSVDGKQDYQKHVVFVAWKDVKFQKTFPDIINFKRLLFDLLDIGGCVRYIFASLCF